MACHRRRTHSQLDIAHRDQEGEPLQELGGEHLDPAEPGAGPLAQEAAMAVRHHAGPELATPPGLLSDLLGWVLPVGVGSALVHIWWRSLPIHCHLRPRSLDRGRRPGALPM